MHTTTVYLICFRPGIPRGARPGNASHYLGSTSYPDPADRLHEHLTGAGSPPRQSRTRPRPEPRDRRHLARLQANGASDETPPPPRALLPAMRDVGRADRQGQGIPARRRAQNVAASAMPEGDLRHRCGLRMLPGQSKQPDSMYPRHSPAPSPRTTSRRWRRSHRRGSSSTRRSRHWRLGSERSRRHVVCLHGTICSSGLPGFVGSGLD